jgi:hypothetical protein
MGVRRKKRSRKTPINGRFQKIFFEVPTWPTPEKPVFSALRKVWSEEPVAMEGGPTKKINPEKPVNNWPFGDVTFSRSRTKRSKKLAEKRVFSGIIICDLGNKIEE